MFTYSQVKAILERALESRERELTARFEAILLERLQEQYSMFSRFSQDSLREKPSVSDDLPSCKLSLFPEGGFLRPPMMQPFDTTLELTFASRSASMFRHLLECLDMIQSIRR